MSQYTPEQVDAEFTRLRTGEPTLYTADMLHAYAATLRQAARVDEDTIALEAARDIAAMTARNHAQHVAKIQVRVLAALEAALSAQPALNEPSGNSGELGAPTAWIVRRTYSHPTAAVATLTFDEAGADDCRERGGDVTPLFTRDALEAALSDQPAIPKVQDFKRPEDGDDYAPAIRRALDAAQPAEHPDDAAVDRFAAAMKEKLAAARAKGRGGWQDKYDCPQQRLSNMLRDHVEKGDPRDVANFCMFLHQRGEAILPRTRTMMELAADPSLRRDAQPAERK